MLNGNLTFRDIKKRLHAKGMRWIMLATFLSMGINTVLGGILVYTLTHPTEAPYFSTSVNRRIAPLFPLSEPNQSDTAVLQWANQAVISVYTYNFVNYAQQLQRASTFFTDAGWRNFTQALQSSNSVDTVKAKKLIVSAVATRSPIILRKGILNGRYSWRVQMPVLVTYQSASEFNQQNLVVTLLIRRISTLDSPRGIGITQFVVG